MMQTFRVVDVDNLLFSYDHQAVVKHISDTNMDFKEEIHRKVQTIKLEDTAELNNRVSSISLLFLIFHYTGRRNQVTRST